MQSLVQSERKYIIEGPDGSPLGDAETVLETLETYFEEVRYEYKEKLEEWRDFNRGKPIRKAALAPIYWILYGTELKYPQCEAYLFGPDGLLVFHAGSPVQRIFITVWLKPGEEDFMEHLLVETGWSHRPRNWRDWFRRR